MTILVEATFVVPTATVKSLDNPCAHVHANPDTLVHHPIAIQSVLPIQTVHQLNPVFVKIVLTLVRMPVDMMLCAKLSSIDLLALVRLAM
jgi:hypothetical protein